MDWPVTLVAKPLWTMGLPGEIAAPGKFEAERFISTAQEWLLNLLTWSVILPRTLRILLYVCNKAFEQGSIIRAGRHAVRGHGGRCHVGAGGGSGRRSGVVRCGPGDRPAQPRPSEPAGRVLPSMRPRRSSWRSRASWWLSGAPTQGVLCCRGARALRGGLRRFRRRKGPRPPRRGWPRCAHVPVLAGWPARDTRLQRQSRPWTLRCPQT